MFEGVSDGYVTGYPQTSHPKVELTTTEKDRQTRNITNENPRTYYKTLEYTLESPEDTNAQSRPLWVSRQ